MDGELKVRPVRRYRVARYPSHDDTSPLETEDRSSVPLSPAARKAIVMLGASAAAAPVAAQDSGSPSAAELAAQGETEPRFEREISGDNPFHSSTSGLPYYAAPFGTGEPMYMSSEVIRQTARSVFAEEGFEMTESVRLEGEGYSFRADAFDATRGVGFAIVDWSSGESDVMQSWMDEPPTTDDPELIGFGDMRALDEPETGEPFVAFVSPYSSEFMVDTGYGPGEFTEEELIERFAQRLREYIRWAEENGAY